ncbi:ribosome maturation factor RimM [Thermopetrobacter sp. TC1]|uniref:ribosome maturation factor RimM n=1 Tax=Thermopetrobacter sp. TC1 TaxID=1495045 RepID=UPI0009DE9298|nr:ribosome maturation factor RimM [Thermopetrobacter sp. TC1]
MSRKEKHEKLVVMGVITSAHGIRGEVKIRSFTETPEDIAAYGPLLLDDGPQEVEILRLRPTKGAFIARLKGVEDRNAAELLRGCKLKLPRERLPEPEDEDTFYYSDLVGLKAIKRDGSPGGEVIAVHDFGSGDLLEIRPEGARETYYLPFTKEAVPQVEIAKGRVIINPPKELEEDALKRTGSGRHKQRRQKKNKARQAQKTPSDDAEKA